MAFYRGDKVKVSAKGIAAGITAKTGGRIRYLACYLATTKGGKTCDKKTCAHAIKDYLWAEWPDGKICSYHHQELEPDGSKAPAIMPDAASFKEKAAEVVEKIKRAKESGTLGADNGHKSDIDWNRYNSCLPGTKAKPRRIVEQHNIIDPDEIDWSVYNGFKSGPLRKTADR